MKKIGIAEMRWSVSYAKAEFILASLHHAPGDIQKNAFRGRLKHLKRLGIPLNSAPGRGKKIDYFEDELLQWVFSLELAEFGIDPASIARLLERSWETILPNFQSAAKNMADDDQDLLFVASPNLMLSSWALDQKPFEFQWIRINDRRVYRLFRRRVISINVSQLYRDFTHAKVRFDSTSSHRKGK